MPWSTCSLEGRLSCLRACLPHCSLLSRRCCVLSALLLWHPRAPSELQHVWLYHARLLTRCCVSLEGRPYDSGHDLAWVTVGVMLVEEKQSP